MITIEGVHIDDKHPDVVRCKSGADLLKLDMFANLPLGNQKQAYLDLWDLLHPKKEENKT